jgi:hypothetical protein
MLTKLQPNWALVGLEAFRQKQFFHFPFRFKKVEQYVVKKAY